MPQSAYGNHDNSTHSGAARDLTLLFSLKHHPDESRYGMVETSEGYIELQLALFEGSDRLQYVTYLLTIDKPDGTQVVPMDAFHAPDGNLTLVLIPAEGDNTQVFGSREDFLNALTADSDGGAIRITGSEIQQTGSYDLTVEILTMGSIRNILPPGHLLPVNLQWDERDVTQHVPVELSEPKPQEPPIPREPVLDLKTDKQHYESGETVEVSANVGPETAKFVRAGNGTIGIRVMAENPQSGFMLMDDISNVTESGGLLYSFQMKGIGTSESSVINVLILSPSSSASTMFNYTYSREKAISSNPMTVDWGGDGEPWLYSVDVYDRRYGEDPLDREAQALEYSFSREIRYKILPEDSATIRKMTGSHLKVGGDNNPAGAWMEVSLDAKRNGTLILDIPIDIVKPNPIKLRGLEARLLDGSAPFDISSNAGAPSSKLLYYNEVEHVIAINFSPEENSFSIGGMTAEPIHDVSLLEAYAIPEFGHMVGVAVGLTLAIVFVTAMRKVKL